MHCLVQPERRPSLASLSPLTLQAQTLRPKGAWQPEKLPNRLGRPGPAPHPAPHHSVTYLPQGDRRGSRCPRSQGSRVARRDSRPGAQSAGLWMIPGHERRQLRATLRESQWDAWRRPSSGAESELELGMGLQLEVGLEPERGPE